jgi:hypothetical protein
MTKGLIMKTTTAFLFFHLLAQSSYATEIVIEEVVKKALVATIAFESSEEREKEVVFTKPQANIEGQNYFLATYAVSAVCRKLGFETGRVIKSMKAESHLSKFEILDILDYGSFDLSRKMYAIDTLACTKK